MAQQEGRACQRTVHRFHPQQGSAQVRRAPAARGRAPQPDPLLPPAPAGQIPSRAQAGACGGSRSGGRSQPASPLSSAPGSPASPACPSPAAAGRQQRLGSPAPAPPRPPQGRARQGKVRARGAAAAGESLSVPAGNAGRRNRGELRYQAGVSDGSPSAGGEGVLRALLHALKSGKLILLCFQLCGARRSAAQARNL